MTAPPPTLPGRALALSAVLLQALGQVAYGAWLHMVPTALGVALVTAMLLWDVGVAQKRARLASAQRRQNLC